MHSTQELGWAHLQDAGFTSGPGKVSVYTANEVCVYTAIVENAQKPHPLLAT